MIFWRGRCKKCGFFMWGFGKPYELCLKCEKKVQRRRR